jgi:hypothetical protein
MPRSISLKDSMVEGLERRVLLAAEYNLFNLLGYNQRGAEWEYRSSGESTSWISGNQEITGKTTVTVAKKRKEFAGILSNLVKTKGKDSAFSLAWAKDDQGRALATGAVATEFSGIPGLSLEVELNGTRVAPKKMEVGKVYRDDGTFSGDVVFVVEGDTISGTFDGTTEVSSRLLGKESITVPAGTFNAVKGRITLEFDGVVELDFGGISIPADVHVVQKTTFWAVPQTGIVRMRQQLQNELELEGEPRETTADAVSKLIEHTPAT